MRSICVLACLASFGCSDRSIATAPSVAAPARPTTPPELADPNPECTAAELETELAFCLGGWASFDHRVQMEIADMALTRAEGLPVLDGYRSGRRRSELAEIADVIAATSAVHDLVDAETLERAVALASPFINRMRAEGVLLVASWCEERHAWTFLSEARVKFNDALILNDGEADERLATKPEGGAP